MECAASKLAVMAVIAVITSCILCKIIWGVKRYKYPDSCPMVYRIDLARNADLAPMSLDELLGNEQTNTCANSGAGRKKCLSNLREIPARYANAVIGNQQDRSTDRFIGVLHGN